MEKGKGKANDYEDSEVDYSSDTTSEDKTQFSGSETDTLFEKIAALEAEKALLQARLANSSESSKSRQGSTTATVITRKVCHTKPAGQAKTSDLEVTTTTDNGQHNKHSCKDDRIVCIYHSMYVMTRY